MSEGVHMELSTFPICEISVSKRIKREVCKVLQDSTVVGLFVVWKRKAVVALAAD